jgi:hypothetical protein
MIPHTPLYDSITGDAPSGGSAPALNFAPTPVEANIPALNQTAPTTQTATSAVKEPFYKSFINADGTLNHKALDNLPDHHTSLKNTLARQKTFDDVLTVMANQQTLAGKKGLAPLPANAAPEVIAERKALLDSINGVPKDPKDYGIAKPENIANELWNEALAKGAAEIAHKYSASPQMLKDLVALQTAELQKQVAAQADYEKNFFSTQQKNLEATLRNENIPLTKAQELAERGAMRLGLDMNNPEHQTLMKNSNVFLMAMRHAMTTSEDKFVSGTSSTNATNNPLELARDMIHNKSNPLYEALTNGSHPQNGIAKARYQSLMVEAGKRGMK